MVRLTVWSPARRLVGWSGNLRHLVCSQGKLSLHLQLHCGIGELGLERIERDLVLVGIVQHCQLSAHLKLLNRKLVVALRTLR